DGSAANETAGSLGANVRGRERVYAAVWPLVWATPSRGSRGIAGLGAIPLDLSGCGALRSHQRRPARVPSLAGWLRRKDVAGTSPSAARTKSSVPAENLLPESPAKRSRS